MLKYSYILFAITFALLAGLVTPSFSHAQSLSEQCGDTSKISDCIEGIRANIAVDGGLSQAGDAPTVLATIINWLLSMVALLAMVALIWGGIMYILSLGDESRATTAKKIILYAIVGLVVVIVSFVIITTVQRFLTASADGFILPGVNTAHAQFSTGIDKIEKEVAKDGSGIAGRDTSIIFIIQDIALYMLALVSVIALIAIIWGGVMYILSVGDESRAEKAKRIILYAIIGIIIALSAFTIIALVREAITGLKAGEDASWNILNYTSDIALGLTHIPIANAAIGVFDRDCESGFDAGFGCTRGTAEEGGISFVGPRATILKIIQTILNLVAVVALAVVIWAGVSYVISLGNEEKVKKAKMTLLYAIIGLVIIGIAIIIVNFIINIFITT